MVSHEATRFYEEGRYADARDAWAASERVAQDPEARRLLQALVQISGALSAVYDTGEPERAARLFQQAVTRLDELPDAMGDLDIAALREAATICRDVLEHGQDGATLQRSRIPVLRKLA